MCLETWAHNWYSGTTYLENGVMNCYLILKFALNSSNKKIKNKNKQTVILTFVGNYCDLCDFWRLLRDKWTLRGPQFFASDPQDGCPENPVLHLRQAFGEAILWRLIEALAFEKVEFFCQSHELHILATSLSYFKKSKLS